MAHGHESVQFTLKSGFIFQSIQPKKAMWSPNDYWGVSYEQSTSESKLIHISISNETSYVLLAGDRGNPELNRYK